MYVLNLSSLFFWLSKIEVDCKYVYWILRFIKVYVIKGDIRKQFFVRIIQWIFVNIFFRYVELLVNFFDELREEWYYKVIMKKFVKYGLVGF